MPGAFPVVASAFILILVAVEWLAGEAYRPWEPIVANEYPSARFDDVFILNPKAGWAVSTSGLFLIAD
jgi:hypothetical protein